MCVYEVHSCLCIIQPSSRRKQIKDTYATEHSNKDSCMRASTTISDKLMKNKDTSESRTGNHRRQHTTDLSDGRRHRYALYAHINSVHTLSLRDN